MDGLSRCIGAGVPHFILGEMRMLRPMRLLDWGACEQWILSKRQEAFDVAIVARSVFGTCVKEDLGSQLRQQSYATFSEIHDFSQTLFGASLTLWLCLSQSVPFGECAECSADELNRFARIRDQISGVDLMQTFDWPFIESAGDDGKKQNWLIVVRNICEAVCQGMSPNEVGSLTLYQLRMLALEFRQLQGTKKIHRSELSAYWKKRRAQEEMELF